MRDRLDPEEREPDDLLRDDPELERVLLLLLLLMVELERVFEELLLFTLGVDRLLELDRLIFGNEKEELPELVFQRITGDRLLRGTKRGFSTFRVR